MGHAQPRLVHVTTTDISLDWLLLPQLTAFSAAGYEVIGASASGTHVSVIEEAGIGHEVVRHATRSMDPRSDISALFELIRIFRRLRPDIVHTHNPKPGLYGRLAAQIAGVPVVVNTVHGLYATADDPWLKQRIVYGLEKLATYWSDMNLVQNPEDVETLLGLGMRPESVELLGNGVDLARFDLDRFRSPRPAASGGDSEGSASSSRDRLRSEIGVGPDDVVVGAVGRLVWEKGYRELFEAMAYLRERFDNARLVVIGPSDESKSDAVDATSIDEATQAGVVFLGHRNDVDAWYAAMDVYVLASHREGFPRSAMEAAAMGLPLVVTDIRGCRQVVTQGENGLLVEPRDSVALAEAIGSLIGDSQLRAKMGSASRKRAVDEFDQQRVIDITLEAYERLLGARRLSAR